ncbi:MAG TPA: DNA polymerase III subunit chi [Gammaproteobacteria bacterium]|nr:DNA polymerase III subunit chi [Gammaproteobacteria bacterium]
MARVDFYILSSEGSDEPLRVACRLAEKAWRQGNRVRVECDSMDALRRLDGLMWTFRQESFLPHEMEGEHDDWQRLDPPPIVLGTAGACAEAPDVLINLSAAVPAIAERCSRIAEIISADPESKRTGRDRYRLYRDRGFDLGSHQI